MLESLFFTEHLRTTASVYFLFSEATVYSFLFLFLLKSLENPRFSGDFRGK